MEERLTQVLLTSYIRNPEYITQWEVDDIKPDPESGIRVNYKPEPVFHDIKQAALHGPIDTRVLAHINDLFLKREAELDARISSRNEARELYLQKHPKERNYMGDLAIIIFLAAILAEKSGTDVFKADVLKASKQLQKYLPRHDFYGSTPDDIVRTVVTQPLITDDRK